VPDGIDFDCDGASDVDLPGCLPTPLDSDGDGVLDALDLDCDGVADVSL
jgi:hypothetical protein